VGQDERGNLKLARRIKSTMLGVRRNQKRDPRADAAFTRGAGDSTKVRASSATRHQDANSRLFHFLLKYLRHTRKTARRA
jgi:hypothetical protein